MELSVHDYKIYTTDLGDIEKIILNCVDQVDDDKVVDVVLCAEGGCCSRSYFQIDEDRLDDIVGKVVTDIDQNYDYDGDGCTKIYDVTIKLDSCNDIVFQLINVSNGYYGGWLSVSYK